MLHGGACSLCGYRTRRRSQVVLLAIGVVAAVIILAVASFTISQALLDGDAPSAAASLTIGASAETSSTSPAESDLNALATALTASPVIDVAEVANAATQLLESSDASLREYGDALISYADAPNDEHAERLRLTAEDARNSALAANDPSSAIALDPEPLIEGPLWATDATGPPTRAAGWFRAGSMTCMLAVEEVTCIHDDRRIEILDDQGPYAAGTLAPGVEPEPIEELITERYTPDGSIACQPLGSGIECRVVLKPDLRIPEGS